MPTYKYKAINSEGKMLDSTITASDKDELVRHLQKLNLIPVKIQEKETARRIQRKFGKKIKTQNVILFTKQLHTLLKSGIPIIALTKDFRTRSLSERRRSPNRSHWLTWTPDRPPASLLR